MEWLAEIGGLRLGSPNAATRHQDHQDRSAPLVLNSCVLQRPENVPGELDRQMTFVGICQNSELWRNLLPDRVDLMFDFILNESTFLADSMPKFEVEL